MAKFNIKSFPSLLKFLGENYLGVGADDKKRNLYKICEELDISVYATKFNNDSLSGLIKKNGTHWEIYVNDTDSSKRKTFTIAHELGHYFSLVDGQLSRNLLDETGVHEDTAIFNRESDNGEKRGADVREMEAEANFIAANLLMPENLVRAAVLENKNIEEMAEEFGVSESALSFRLINLNLPPMESIGSHDGR